MSGSEQEESTERADEVAFVVNPTSVQDLSAFRGKAEQACRRLGLARPLWSQTTPSDRGRGAATRALASGARVVVACGGDGTVNDVAAAIVHTDAALGVLPSGTGNLLARNYGIPTDIDQALTTALAGRDRLVDTGTLDGHRFVGMAGAGLNAAMVRDASPALKRRLGWLAYVPPTVRALRGGRFTVRISSAGAVMQQPAALGLLAGNVSGLHGGLRMLPNAVPDDGILDLALLAPRGLAGWTRAGTQLLTGWDTQGRSDLVRLRGTRFEIELNSPQPIEVDGDICGEASSFVLEVDPHSLALRVSA